MTIYGARWGLSRIIKGDHFVNYVIVCHNAVHLKLVSNNIEYQNKLINLKKDVLERVIV